MGYETTVPVAQYVEALCCRNCPCGCSLVAKSVAAGSAGLGRCLADVHPAVMIAALYGGLYAGLLATILSSLTVTFLWPSIVPVPLVIDVAYWFSTGIFVLNGCLSSGVAELMHRAQQRAMDAQADIDEVNQFRLLFESSPTAMLCIDALNGRVTQTNLVARKMFGYTADEFLLKTALELTCPDDHDESVRRNAQLSSGAVNYLHFEKRYLKKDGSCFWAESYVSTLKNNEGVVDRYIGSTIDLTEQKLAQQQKREMEER